MSDWITIPVKTVNNGKWAQLSYFGNSHLICGEKFNLKKENFTFADGHRVRLYKVKSNVHWKIPAGTPLDIEKVTLTNLPRRRSNR